MGDFISQEEIDALLNQSLSALDNDSDSLSSHDKDALGELGNISMGTSANTLSQILDKKVSITTPEITVLSVEELMTQYANSYVAVRIEYTTGIKGSSFLIMEEDDVKKITDIMMGGDGTNTSEDVNGLHLSAIGEAMNQMVGSSATSLSKMIGDPIDISPPKSIRINFEDQISELSEFSHGEKLVKISFKCVVEDLIDSHLIQLYPLSFARDMISKLMNPGGTTVAGTSTSNKPSEYIEAPVTPSQNANTNFSAPPPNNQQFAMPQQNMNFQQEQINQIYGNQMGNMSGAMPNYGYDPNQQQYQGGQWGGGNQPNQYNANQRQGVNVQPANFKTFDESKVTFEKKNVDIIMDVPLGVTVELGRTSKLIKDILAFGTGTIIELDKLAGEAVDILVNGKIIAKGEVVVIDESFGVRITEIVSPQMRL